METITLGDRRIKIKTSVLEEKATACNMLCCYVDELKKGFFPWVDKVTLSIGDDHLKPGVTAEPEITKTILSDDDEYLVPWSNERSLENKELNAIIGA
nr:importin-5-like isoform X2 [Tanacetum cinerariifolium]